MTGPGCFSTEDRPISDSQVYTLYADYKFNQQPTLDHCDVSIRATEPNRRLRYYVEKLTIFDCGIRILIFDNPRNLNIPAVSRVVVVVCWVFWCVLVINCPRACGLLISQSQ